MTLAFVFLFVGIIISVISALQSSLPKRERLNVLATSMYFGSVIALAINLVRSLV